MDAPNLKRTLGEYLSRPSSQRFKKTEVLRCWDGEEGDSIPVMARRGGCFIHSDFCNEAFRSPSHKPPL